VIGGNYGRSHYGSEFVAERISDAEHAVMEVLWDESPLTAQEVVERVDPGRGWSANTVKTLLGRLLTKTAISAQEDGRRYLYRPQVERGDYVAGESKRLMDRLFGGKLTPLVAHLAERDQLSDADIAEIEALLRDLKK
jgi:predicted transcriptional regulator